jgi:hypothetical protein
MCTISELDWEGEERAALRTTYIGTPDQNGKEGIISIVMLMDNG